jgi:hypothetical protein
MALPVLTRAFFFSTDGRPYGLLLGLLGIAMVSWQSATREEGRRLIPLILLALALAMILNTSYSGVLLFAPFCIAELFRTFQRRRIDLPMVAAIGAGGAGIVPVLPFMKAAMQHRSYYYFPSELIAPRTIFKVYLQVFSPASRAFDDAKLNPRLAIVLIILALALLGLILRGRRRYSPRSNPEMVLLAVLVLLPVLGFLLGRFGTHSFEPRHSIGMALGVAGFAGIGISTYPWGKRAANLILTVFLLAIVLFGIRSIHQARSVTQKTMSALLASPEVKAAIMASPSQQLYTGSFDLFEKLTYYETDPYIQAHISLVFSRDQEIRYRHMDTESLAAMHMLTFTQFNIVPWETLIAQPGDHVFVFHPNSDWDWTQRALAVDHAEVKPVGQAFGADVVSVRFRP